MDITRYGQSALLIEEQGTRILIDPGSLSGEHVFALDRLDALLLTHDHPDHLDPDGVARLVARSPDALVLAPAEVLDALPVGADRAIPVSDGQAYRVGAVDIEVVGSLHQLIHERIPQGLNVGYVLGVLGGARLFHPGDSYESAPSGITALALPLLGPWGSLREAIDFADAVAPRHIFPIHDVHLSAMGRELFWSWLQKFSLTDMAAFDPPIGYPVGIG
ncbi:MBL fold metallo-hydrolase [Microbacterium schleiferi]|uniref:MBL fold metallo-hydrolase n=1 Tax=Microbacterium schleiferi TaxID=69362 RepID=UPI00311D6808